VSVSALCMIGFKTIAAIIDNSAVRSVNS